MTVSDVTSLKKQITQCNDISEAMDIVNRIQNKFRSMGPRGGTDEVIFEIYRYGIDGPYNVIFKKKPNKNLFVMASSYSLVESICLAALETIERYDG